MELKNKEKFEVKFSYVDIPDNIDKAQFEKKKEKDKKAIEDFCEKIENSYKAANCYDDFEQNFFFNWYNIKDRFSLFPLVEPLLNHYKIKLPEFFVKDKNLFYSTLEQKRKIREQNKNKKEDEKGEKILEDIIDIGGARLEIYRNKEQDIEEKLKLELKQKEFKEKIDVIKNQAKQLVNESTSYFDYLQKLRPLYYKLYDIIDYYNKFELFEGIIRYSIPYEEKIEWRDKIPKITRSITFRSVEKFSLEEIESFKKKEEMLERYENEYYVIRPMIFNDNYSIGERENFILQLLEVSKNYPDLFKFISESVEKQKQGFLDRDKEYNESVEALKDEQITIYKKLLSVIEKLNLTNEEKKEAYNQIDETYRKLLGTNLKKSFYYSEYKNIKAKIDRNEYNSNERDRANKLGIDSFMEWKYAFYVLAFRNENNIHFKSIIKNENENEIEFTKDSLDSCFTIFHNAYKTQTHRKTNK